MDKDNIHLERIVLFTTSRCTLNCKLCLAYIPYYEKQTNANFSELKEDLKQFFTIATSTKTLTITGASL